MDNSSPTLVMPVLKPYLPVIIALLVGVQAGVAQTLSKTIPFNAKSSSIGVTGGLFEYAYCEEESRP